MRAQRHAQVGDGTDRVSATASEYEAATTETSQTITITEHPPQRESKTTTTQTRTSQEDRKMKKLNFDLNPGPALLLAALLMGTRFSAPSSAPSPF